MTEYNYEDLKPELFTEGFQPKFLEVRDTVRDLISVNKVFRLDALITIVTGDSWLIVACVDRLVELGEITEVLEVRGCVPLQHRIFF